MTDPTSRALPRDQAHGLRRLFPRQPVQFVPVVSNPHLSCGGLMLERLCAAFGTLGRHTLVVDAAENSPLPAEMAKVELGACVETLSAQVSYLAARGLPLRHVDARGSTASFLQAASLAAPHATVVLVHASASDLCRLFMPAQPGSGDPTRPRPLLLADDRPTSVTHAYAAMKLLTQRAGLVVHDLLLAAAPHSPRTERIAMQLATCADDFLGAVLRDWVQIDPAGLATEPPDAALRRWALAALQPQDAAVPAGTLASAPGLRAAAPRTSHAAWALN